VVAVCFSSASEETSVFEHAEFLGECSRIKIVKRALEFAKTLYFVVGKRFDNAEMPKIREQFESGRARVW